MESHLHPCLPEVIEASSEYLRSLSRIRDLVGHQHDMAAFCEEVIESTRNPFAVESLPPPRPDPRRRRHPHPGNCKLMDPHGRPCSFQTVLPVVLEQYPEEAASPKATWDLLTRLGYRYSGSRILTKVRTALQRAKF